MKLADLKSGDLLYWKGKGFRAAFVRWWTRPSFFRIFESAPYSHVGIFILNGGTPFYLDADPNLGVRLKSFFEDPPDAGQHTHTAWTQKVMDEVVQVVGRPYSWKTLVLTPFGIAGHGFSAFVCSELVAHILAIAGWDWKGLHLTPMGLLFGVRNATGFLDERIDP